MVNKSSNRKLYRKLSEVTVADWVKTGLLLVASILMIVWIGNPWLIFLLPLVADLYTTKFVNWGFWKGKKDGKKTTRSVIVEWVDAILFAAIAVYFINLFFFQNYKIPTSSLEKSLLVGDHLFVSKVSYGPRMPTAPLALPMVQNTLPFGNCKSYLEWPLWDYKRLAGTDSIRRNDIVVFNFPAGDTVCLAMPNPDYYSIVLTQGINSVTQDDNKVLAGFSTAWERNHYLMELGRRKVMQPTSPLSDIVWRPVDKRDCYVKRCIGMPGDTLSIRHNVVYIDGEKLNDMPDVQHNYFVTTNGAMLNDKFFENLGISNEDRRQGGVCPHYYLPLTREKAEMVAKMSFVTSVTIDEEPADSLGTYVYPFSPDYPWSRDNYGPIWIPKRGESVALTPATALLYERAIVAYEGHSLDVRDGKVYVDDAEADSYTFEMDYFFMMGDNRHKSADSRYWGLVPEDHVIGRPMFVWLSLDPDKSFPSSIRWDRFFKTDFDRQ